MEVLAQLRIVSVGVGVIPNLANNINITRTVLGLFIGAILVRYASYHWVFWFVGMVAIPVALCCLFMIPPEIVKSEDKSDMRSAKWESLDPIGILILTGVLHLREILITSV